MHTRDNPLPYREIIRKLTKFGIQEIQRKGAKIILYHPNINGKPASYPWTFISKVRYLVDP